jgi:hypothetical protein
MTTEYIGPFIDKYKLLVEGCIVPYLTATKNNNGDWNLTLDERYGITATEEEVGKWLWFLAYAMAVAAGYTCFGENSKQMNLFSRVAHGISVSEIDDIQNDTQ